MHAVLAQSLPLVGLVFLASAMFSVGLDLTPPQIIAPLRDRRLLGAALAVNVVLVPLAGIAISRVIPMDPALAIGLVVYALAAGTEGGPKFVQLAKGNAGFAVGLLALLLSITVAFMPAALSVAIPDVHVDRLRLILKLLAAVAVPIGLGLFLRARYPAFASRLGLAVHRASLVLLCVFFMQVIYVYYDAMLALQGSALLAGLLYFAFAFGAGFVMGGPKKENRRTLAIMTFVRNAPISMTTASQVFPHDPGVLVMVTVMCALSPVIGVVAVVGFRRFGS